jgi:hypothetical protein
MNYYDWVANPMGLAEKAQSPPKVTMKLSRTTEIVKTAGWRISSFCEASWLHTDRSVPLGMYWRSSPLVFSLMARCQGLCGGPGFVDGDQLLAKLTVRHSIDRLVDGLVRDLVLGMIGKHSLQCAADLLRRPLVSQHVDDHLMEVSALD